MESIAIKKKPPKALSFSNHIGVNLFILLLANAAITSQASPETLPIEQELTNVFNIILNPKSFQYGEEYTQ